MCKMDILKYFGFEVSSIPIRYLYALFFICFSRIANDDVFFLHSVRDGMDGQGRDTPICYFLCANLIARFCRKLTRIECKRYSVKRICKARLNCANSSNLIESALWFNFSSTSTQYIMFKTCRGEALMVYFFSLLEVKKVCYELNKTIHSVIYFTSVQILTCQR